MHVPPFHPGAPDAPGIVSWVHLGDLHMTRAGAATDTIRIVVGASAYRAPERQPRDQDNAVAAWPERGLLGTQLGPNKNGRKW